MKGQKGDSKMAKYSIGYGVLLCILGLAGYLATNRVSVTALIPFFFGLPMIILGLLAFKENLRKHVMHAAAAIALLGFLGTFKGFFSFMAYLTGRVVERPPAVIAQGIMAILSAIFVALAVHSFIQARKNQTPRTSS
jgi:uncharacterized membrane protein